MASTLKLLSAAAAASGTVSVPPQFAEPVRDDLIKRAVLALASHGRQPYGTKPGAGMRHSARVSKRRRDYRTSYGMGISRVPRKIHSRQGSRMNWVGANAPGMVGGRPAHPPKAAKVWAHKINDTERRKAIRSALAATLDPARVAARGHRVPDAYPFAVEAALEGLGKAKDIVAFLAKSGFQPEIDRLCPALRTGRARRRGRSTRVPRGPLFVVSKPCPLMKAAANVPGVDVCEVSRLNAHLLAPGSHPGRLVLFTEAALGRIAAERLFTDHPAAAKQSPASRAAPTPRPAQTAPQAHTPAPPKPSAHKAGEPKPIPNLARKPRPKAAPAKNPKIGGAA